LTQLRNEAGNDVLVILVANQKDFESHREVSWEKGAKYAKDHNFFKFVEVSAKSGENIYSLFEEVIKFLYIEHQKKSETLKNE